MNTFEIQFKPSAAACAAALKQGKVLPREMTIIVDPADLTAAQRELILHIGTPTAGSTLKLSQYENPDGEDLKAVLEHIVKMQQSKASKEAEQKAEAEREATEKQAKARRYVAGETNDVYFYNYENADTGDAELDAAVAAEYRRREAEKQAKAEAEKAAKAEAVETMRLWALDNGSDHLKDLITEGFNWQSVAREEWIEMNTPDGFSNVGDEEGYEDWYEIKNPSPRAIAVLRETRKTHPKCSLMRVKFDDGRHDDYISIDLFPPIGNKVSREKFIENYSSQDED